MRVEILYFARLRDAAGRARESVQTDARDLRSLYAQQKRRHDLPMDVSQLRVAVDGAFSSWDASPTEGSEVAFIPPVSGG